MTDLLSGHDIEWDIIAAARFPDELAFATTQRRLTRPEPSIRPQQSRFTQALNQAFGRRIET